MSTAAQLAQKSKTYIAGTSGSAKTITAITVGYPTLITSSAHGLANGDILAIAGITGTVGTDGTSGLNGKSLTAKYVTTNTFSVDVNTTGLAYTSGGTATPSLWIQIKEIKGIKPSGASGSKIDVTDLDSDAMEYRTGLIDNGTLSLDVNILESDPGQAAALAAFIASTSTTFKVATPAKNRTFAGSVAKWPTIPDASVNGVQTGSAEIQISGAVTVA